MDKCLLAELTDYNLLTKARRSQDRGVLILPKRRAGAQWEFTPTYPTLTGSIVHEFSHCSEGSTKGWAPLFSLFEQMASDR